MTTTPHTWGRKETVVWPPKSPIYTYGAILLAVLATCLSLWIRFAFTLTPIERFYVPYSIRAEAGATFNKSDKFQLLMLSDGIKRTHFAYAPDVTGGDTEEANGKHIPLVLSAAATAAGYRYLFQGPATLYKDKPLSAFIRQAFFKGESLMDLFGVCLWLGLGALLLQLPFSIRKDIARRKIMKYGRLLKGPIMNTPKEFNRVVGGEGIGFQTSESEKMMCLPAGVEDRHIEIMGDTGSGKTQLIIQILRQVQTKKHAAIVYDPACEYVQQFYDESRGDVILNPLDARCPYWGPSEELRRRAEAKAVAASLYQPTSDKKGEFFIETPQKIFAHLLTFGPTPQELVQWLCSPDEIDRRVQGTEMAEMISKTASDQRSGVLASLGLIADSLRMLPTKEEAGGRTWTATNWAETRKGWIFITSKPTDREALRPLQSLWIDLLVLRLLSAPKPDQIPVWFVIDELASLQRLPQLCTALTENRKSRNPLVLGFQGKAQLEFIYGHLAEVMLSQPATKIFLTTTEPKAAEWVSNAIGKIEIERLKESKSDGNTRTTFALDRQVEPLVMDSEIAGLPPRSAFLKLGNNVARFSFAYSVLPEKTPAFEPRQSNDDLMFDPITLRLIPPTLPPPVPQQPVATPTAPVQATSQPKAIDPSLVATETPVLVPDDTPIGDF